MNNKVSYFLPPFNIGGIECVFINYANVLNNNGVCVDFVVCKLYGVLKNCVSPRVNIVSLGNIQLRFSFLKLRSYIKQSQSLAILSITKETFLVYNLYLLFAYASSFFAHNERGYLLAPHLLLFPWIMIPIG